MQPTLYDFENAVTQKLIELQKLAILAIFVYESSISVERPLLGISYISCHR